MATWGKVIGTGMVALGAATLGVSALGESIGGVAADAANAVNSTGADVAAKIGLGDAVSGKTAAAVAGAATALAGAGVLYASGKDHDDDDEKKTKAAKEMEAIAEVGRRMRRLRGELGLSDDNTSPRGMDNLPPPPERDGPER